MLNFHDYQIATKELAIYPDARTGSHQALSYCLLGLTGEAGEAANKLKKILRDGDTPERRQSLIDELGDTLWYISQAAAELNVSLEHLAMQNLSKLRGRRERNTVHGDGDNR